MTAIQVVRNSCFNGDLNSAIEAHKTILSTVNRIYPATQKEDCSTETHDFARKAAIELHESACMIQSCFDIEVPKFQTI